MTRAIGRMDILNGLSAASGILFSILLAVVSYRYFERPLMQFFRRRVERASFQSSKVRNGTVAV